MSQNPQLELSIGLSKDLTIISRSNYTFLELIGDVGAVFGTLYSIAAFILNNIL